MDLSSETKSIGVYKENRLIDNVFINDKDIQFVFKKTERIVKAIYLITNFFYVLEPLKWDLRKSASKLLKSVMSFSKSSLSDKESQGHILSSNVLEVLSLLDIAYNSGFITQMNYEVLNYEINKIAIFIDEYVKSQTVSNKSLFNNKTFFVEDKNNIKDNLSQTQRIYKGHNEKYNVLYKKTSKESLNKTKPVGSNNLKRHEEIINLIKDKGEVSVKDIALVINDCSEKTIQRELQSLIKSGVLEKRGERRWSRYFLKK